MKYVLYVDGMPFDGNTIGEGKSLGGSESAGYYVAKELASRGHNVFCFSNIPDNKPKLIDGVSYMPIGEKSKDHPFGRNFLEYIERVPSDVILAQRAPHVFMKRYNSKINLWWTHDLALKRSQQFVNAQIWNLDGVMTVSDFHKDQLSEVYNIDKKIVSLLPNGIDTKLYERVLNKDDKWDSKTIVYSSRPERGLINLVSPGGIMEQLYKIDPEIKLVVCGYDNTTPDMINFYRQLWQRCEELPNVTNYGPLSKKALADLECGSWLHCYPTEFEETSCITAMQEQAAGTPFMTTRTGALPETLKDGGVVWLDKNEDDTVDNDRFVRAIADLSKDKDLWLSLHDKCLEKAKTYSWKKSVDLLEERVAGIFEDRCSNKERLVKHYIRNSDIVAAKKLSDSIPELSKYSDFIHKHFGFAFNDEFQNHYDDVADYNINEIKNTHNLGNDQFQFSMPRIKPIIDFLASIPKDKDVLDYGCCVGQQTIAYARAFPHLNFKGVDISQHQIDIANQYAKENNINNVAFKKVSSPSDIIGKYDAVICSEVLEHVLDANKFLDTLEECCTGMMLYTVPAGPHEEVRYDVQVRREHLHHFEDQDIIDMVGRKPGFRMTYASSQPNKYGKALGNYAFIYNAEPGTKTNRINYLRKNKQQAPRETLSVCMIVKPDGDTLAKTLRSIEELADEIIIGIDGVPNKGRAWEIAESFNAKTFEINSPMNIGFDAARNLTIEKATKDWIMWIDDDETFVWPEKLEKYLRPNQYTSYAVNQHHYSADPPSLMKTDMPCRIFRNHQGIKFYGVVHEHPETEMNKGCGHSFLVPHNEIAICHNGYTTEDTRRDRFKRNWPLMQKDHEVYPDRELGKFLYMRDLVHLNRFEMEQTGGLVTPGVKQRCETALSMWREMISQKKIRLVNDGLPYMNECVMVLTNGQGIEFEVGMAANCMGIGDTLNGSALPSKRTRFLDKKDIKSYIDLELETKLSTFDQKYL